MIRVVNYHKWTLGGENIMRPGVFGNPFSMQALGITREESLSRYRDWLYAQIESKSGIYEELSRLLHFAKQGDDVTLICACKPKACHGDIIKEWIETALLDSLPEEML